jgi:CheY-like chemotaxis protein
VTTARRVICRVPDLFFSARIAETAQSLGVTLEAPAGEPIADACRRSPPDLVILDLHAPESLGVARSLKADPMTAAIPIVGFYAHVDRDLRQAALAAGIDHVVPRSAFTAKLAAFLAGEPPRPSEP